MRVPENIRKCVAYVSFMNPKGNLQPVGSVFFLGRVKDDDSSKADRVFAVTARHVIDGLRTHGIKDVYIRLNLNKRASPLGYSKSSVDDWFVHSSDDSIDVALLEMGIPTECDHLVLPMTVCLTEEKLHENEVGLGDEVFVVGLFRHHVGKGKNIPIIRVGNLSALDEEPVSTHTFGDMKAYLIEARSIGGLSGSPVILNLGNVRSIGGTVKFANSKDPLFFLLGLIHGHYDSRGGLVDAASGEVMDTTDAVTAKINTGVAIVVPFYSILSVIEEFETK